MWHVYPLYGTPEGKRALEEMSAFIRSRVGLAPLNFAEEAISPAK